MKTFATIVAVLAFAPAASAQTFQFVATNRVRTVRIPGSGHVLALQEVDVDGKPILFGERNASTMYGRGVAIRFVQRGTTFYARAVTVANRALISVRYGIG